MNGNNHQHDQQQMPTIFKDNDDEAGVEQSTNIDDVITTSNDHLVDINSPTSKLMQQPPAISQRDENNDQDINTLTSRLIERSSYRHSRRRHHNGSSSSSHRHRSASILKHDDNFMTTNTVPISRKSSDCSATTMSELTTDKDYLDYIAKLQMDSLIPLKEDVAGKLF